MRLVEPFGLPGAFLVMWMDAVGREDPLEWLLRGWMLLGVELCQGDGFMASEGCCRLL